IDENNEKKYPYLLHASISGGVERNICAILEKEAIKMERGHKGNFPFWLAPTQVRFIPVKEEFVKECISLAKKINARVDVDDRDMSVSKRIREAEKEWVPIIIVYGEEERKGIFKPRYRFECQEKEITLEKLNEMVEEKMKNFPLRGLSLPMLISQRPRFK
ncbi:MAG: threonine--tRNA ligase, partial [Deltaproteobacteria bacterium]